MTLSRLLVTCAIWQQTHSQTVDMTTAVTTTAGNDIITDVIPKSVIGLAILGAALLIGVLVAKAVDHYHDIQALRDDASDMSDHTRQLLKTRLALLAFQKRPSVGHERNQELARKYAYIWRSKVLTRRAFRKQPVPEVKVTQPASKRPSINVQMDAKRPSIDVRTEPILEEPEELESVVSEGTNKKQPTKSPKSPKPAKSAPQKKDLASKMTISQRLKAANVENQNIKTPPGEKQTQSGAMKSPKGRNKSEQSPAPNKADVTVPEPDVTLHKTYIEFRGDSDDLMIPVKVSTDERIIAKPLTITTTRPQNGVSNPSDPNDF